MMKQQLEPKLGDGTALHLIAGSVAGCISAIAMSPVWLVKTRLQLQTKEMAQQGLAYKNSWDCVRRVYKEEGILAFYKGLAPSLIGMIGLSIQFTLYEKGKAIILARKGNNAELDSVEYLAVASAAKGIASVITYPHEVLRTRFREQRAVKNPKYTGIVQALKLIAKEEGLAAWYGGMGPHLLKVVPNSAFMFLTYEVVVRLLTPRDDEGV
jgi:solute carrier family 25 protein 33/36